MEFRNKSGICLGVVLLGSLVTRAGTPANQLSAAEAKAGFKLLFDGVNTSQWTINWGIEDSAMHSPNTGAMIYSKEQFTNFEWKIDFKVNDSGNSGFFIHTTTDWYCNGFEVAVLDSKDGGDADARSNSANMDKLPAGVFNVNTGKNFVAGSDAPIKRSGAIYDIYPTTKNGIPIPNGGEYVDPMKPAMQWNSMVIWANGNNIETWLNGMKVTDFVIGSPDYMTRYHRSKFGNGNNQCGDNYGKTPTGTLVVQDHGGGLYVWMRSIKIRPFTPGSKLTSPVVTPNGGAFASATKITLDAGITGASIRYTLDGSDPTETSPLYNDSTGLLIGATATLKTKTFRANFSTSDAASAAFTIAGTGINGKSPTLNPEVGLSQLGKRLLITNRNGVPFSADIVSIAGKTAASFGVSKTTSDISLANLKSGLYLVQMRSGSWNQSQKILLP